MRGGQKVKPVRDLLLKKAEKLKKIKGKKLDKLKKISTFAVPTKREPFDGCQTGNKRRLKQCKAGWKTGT